MVCIRGHVRYNYLGKPEQYPGTPRVTRGYNSSKSRNTSEVYS